MWLAAILREGSNFTIKTLFTPFFRVSESTYNFCLNTKISKRK